MPPIVYRNEEEKADTESTLHWFLPKHLKDSSEEAAFGALLEKYINGPVRALLGNSRAESRNPQLVRGEAARLGQCLLAPLLKVHPWYRGPLITAPPDQWLVKLIGAKAHVQHVPYWQERLSRDKGVLKEEIQGCAPTTTAPGSVIGRDHLTAS